MKTISKKIVSLLVSALMICALLPGMAFAEAATVATVDELKAAIEAGKTEITVTQPLNISG